MSRIGMLTFPAIRDGKNFVSNIKRNTKHSRVRQKHSTRAPAGLPGVEHQTQNAARNHVHRCPPSNHVQPETQVSHISQGDRNEPSPKAPSSKHGILRFTKKTPKKKQYNDLVFYALKRNWHIVQSCFKQPVRAVLSFKVQSNLFRRDFASNWLCAARSGCGG